MQDLKIWISHGNQKIIVRVLFSSKHTFFKILRLVFLYFIFERDGYFPKLTPLDPWQSKEAFNAISTRCDHRVEFGERSRTVNEAGLLLNNSTFSKANYKLDLIKVPTTVGGKFNNLIRILSTVNVPLLFCSVHVRRDLAESSVK